MILMSCNHIENELCEFNELKYIIFIPQFTTNDLGKSSDQAFQKQHFVQDEHSLIMHSLMCMCAYTHTYYKWFTSPYYLLFLYMKVKRQIYDSCNSLDINVSSDYLVGVPYFKDATVLVQPQFQKKIVDVVPSISFVHSF